jgi:iron complex transport system substrate-binding protein
MTHAARVVAVACVLAACAACERSRARPSDPGPSVDVSRGLGTNVLDGTVNRFDPSLDYFPDKVSFRYSRQVSIEYHKHYKRLTIVPEPNPNERFEYVLVQRGTPVPPVPRGVRVIEVPVRTLALTHGELLGAAEMLGLDDRLVALNTIRGIRLPRLRALVARGTVTAVGSGKHVDVERLISLQPDLVLTYWSVSPDYSAHPVLDQAGIQTVVLSSHWETSTLAMAEWVKVMAVLFNRERIAQERFGAIAARYEDLSARARAQPRRPMVLTRLPFRHMWSVGPAPREIEDAGGRYFWPDGRRPKSVDVEAVLDKARDADAWTIAFPTPIRTQEELLAREPRLGLLRAVQRAEVWNYDRLDYDRQAPYHDRRMRPDLELADLIKILHPQLVPDHEFVFFRRLDPPPRNPLSTLSSALLGGLERGALP